MQLCGSLSILWHCLSLGLEWNWPFLVLWSLLNFPNLLAYWVQHFTVSSFSTWYSSTPRREWQPTPVLSPGKSHEQRSLVGFSPWGRKESDTTVRLHFHFSLSCIGEGNGNPLQCSCLENPRDGAASWAAIYGVAQSQTRLKWLSSSSSSSNPGDWYIPS